MIRCCTSFPPQLGAHSSTPCVYCDYASADKRAGSGCLLVTQLVWIFMCPCRYDVESWVGRVSVDDYEGVLLDRVVSPLAACAPELLSCDPMQICISPLPWAWVPACPPHAAGKE